MEDKRCSSGHRSQTDKTTSPNKRRTRLLIDDDDDDDVVEVADKKNSGSTKKSRTSRKKAAVTKGRKGRRKAKATSSSSSPPPPHQESLYWIASPATTQDAKSNQPYWFACIDKNQEKHEHGKIMVTWMDVYREDGVPKFEKDQTWQTTTYTPSKGNLSF